MWYIRRQLFVNNLLDNPWFMVTGSSLWFDTLLLCKLTKAKGNRFVSKLLGIYYTPLTHLLDLYCSVMRLSARVLWLAVYHIVRWHYYYAYARLILNINVSIYFQTQRSRVWWTRVKGETARRISVKLSSCPETTKRQKYWAESEQVSVWIHKFIVIPEHKLQVMFNFMFGGGGNAVWFRISSGLRRCQKRFRVWVAKADPGQDPPHGTGYFNIWEIRSTMGLVYVVWCGYALQYNLRIWFQTKENLVRQL